MCWVHHPWLYLYILPSVSKSESILEEDIGWICSEIKVFSLMVTHFSRRNNWQWWFTICHHWSLGDSHLFVVCVSRFIDNWWFSQWCLAKILDYPVLDSWFSVDWKTSGRVLLWCGSVNIPKPVRMSEFWTVCTFVHNFVVCVCVWWVDGASMMGVWLGLVTGLV